MKWSPRLWIVLVCAALCWPAVAVAQSASSSETTASKAVPPSAMRTAANFDGTVDASVNVAYLCKGVTKFVPAPTARRPDNQALLLTLDPRKSTSVGRCEPDNAGTERAELAEPDDLRLPLGTEVWYGFRFKIPAAMKGKFAGERVVLAQMKQHPDTCALAPEPFGVSAASEGNPTVSLRLIEDDIGDVMGLQLAVSSERVRKIVVGQLMRHRAPFLDRWHDVVLHVKLVPLPDCDCERPDSKDVGFLEGWMDGQPFLSGRYGMHDDGTADPAEPFGYSGLTGCTYFKYGIYRDRQAEPWTIAFDRFRRGATRQDVELSPP